MYDLNSPEVDDFLTKWFGNGTFQFGQNRSKYAYNLNEYKQYILDCKKNKEPAFSSVSPRARIERIFWEFDAEIESRSFSYNSPLLDNIWNEVMTLYLRIKEKGGKPLIIYSGNRGFHLWVYAFSTQIPFFENDWETDGKAIYKLLHKDILGDKKDLPSYDIHPTDVNSLARIPFSYHQKSGNQVIPLTPLRYPFMPLVDDFISCPLDAKYVNDIWKEALGHVAGKRLTRYKQDTFTKYNIRPCVLEAMRNEPTHYARLAFVMDAIYAGLSDEDIHALMKSYTKGDDYNEYATQYQLNYQREKVKEGFKPPSNETLVEWGILKSLPKPIPNPFKFDKKA